MRKANLIVAVAVTFALLSIFAPPIQSQDVRATPEQIDALKVQVDWVNRIASDLEARGVSLSGPEARDLRIIHAQLERFQEHRRTSSQGQTGVRREKAEELQDRIATLWSSLREKVRAADSARREARRDARDAEQSAQTVTTIPRGTRAIVRLTTWLSSKNAAIGDRFSSILADPIVLEGREAVPRGAVLEGLVTDVDRAGRRADAGMLQLQIDRLRGDQGQIAHVHGLVVGTASGDDLKGDRVDVKKTTAVGAVGGVIGALLGGARGALIGIGVGAGGTILADKGEDVDLPQGSLLRVEFQEPVSVTWSWRPMQSQ